MVRMGATARRGWWTAAVVVGLMGLEGSPKGNLAWGQVGAKADQAVEPLSKDALMALVSGVALYPDPVLEQIFDAAANPFALHAAAQPGRGPAVNVPIEFPASVQYLKQEQPKILAQLDQHLALTSRLGLAVKQQPDDVWSAVDAFRAQVDLQLAAQQAAGESTTTASGGSASPIGVAAAAGYVAGRWIRPWAANAYVADSVATNTTVVTPAGGSVATNSASGAAVGPNGTTVEGSGASVVATSPSGNTKVGVASGSVTVSGAGGGTATASGGVQGSVTQSAGGTTVQTQTGGTVTSNVGVEGSAVRGGSTTTVKNADGSTTVQQSASGSATGANGSATVNAERSGTVNGDGTGTYQGSTTVNSTKGNVSTDATAGSGQVSTTVTTDQGQKTFVAGDGQVTNLPSGSTGGSSQAHGARSSAQRSSDARYSKVDSGRMAEADQLMAKSWGQLSSSPQGASLTRSTPSTRSGSTRHNPTQGTTSRKPSAGSRSTPTPAPSARSVPSPSRNTPSRSAPSRSSPSKGGRRR